MPIGRKLLLALAIILLTAIPCFAGYGDSGCGTVMYGGTPDSAVDAAVELAGASVVSNGNTIDMVPLLALDGNAVITNTHTLSIVTQLALDVVGQMAAASILDAYGAVALTAAINQTPIVYVDYSTVVLLIGFASHAPSEGTTLIPAVTIQAIADMIISNSVTRQGAVSLGATASMESANTTIQNAVTSLIATGNYTAAANLVLNGSILLQASITQTDSSSVDWAAMVTLSSIVSSSTQGLMAGVAYDAELTLSMVTSIVEASNLEITGTTELTGEAAITAALTGVIRAGAVTLQAQGNYESSSQLIYLGSVLLSTIATNPTTSNQIFSNAPLILGAIASYVTGSTTQLENIVTRIRFEMNKPRTEFDNNIPFIKFEMVR